MNIAFFGTPEEVTPIIDVLVKRFTITFVITTPDKPTGRKQLRTPPPVKTTAQKYNIPVLQPEKLDDTFKTQLSKADIDLFVVASYGKIIPKHILTIPKQGAINIHPSLLPKFRGPTPIQTTLLQQEKETGITFILMDEEVDHGPMLKQIPFPLKEDNTFASLMQDMFAKAAEELPDVITDYSNGRIIPVPQNEAKATFTKTITKQDGYLDIHTLPDKQQIRAMIHAYYPWPGVWTSTELKGKEVRIKLLPDKKLQMEGKSPVSMKDFINGYPELKDFVETIY